MQNGEAALFRSKKSCFRVPQVRRTFFTLLPLICTEKALQMIRPSLALALALGLALPLLPQAAVSKISQVAIASPSCFGPQDYCLKKLSKTRDRDYYELCILSERICRSYVYDWKFVRSAMIRYQEPPWEGVPVPVHSVGDLLKVCKGEEVWQQAACRQNIPTPTPKAELRRRHSLSGTGSRLAICARPASISDTDQYIKVFIDWAEKHPSQQDLSLHDGLAKAEAAWRCGGDRTR